MAAAELSVIGFQFSENTGQVCGDCDCENGFARNVADVVKVVNVVHGFCDILCRRCRRRRRDGFVGQV